MNEHDLSQAVWRKSSYSNGQANCVEVARNLPGIVAIRDSKAPDSGVLVLTNDEWQHFAQNYRCTETKV
jgi:Domain of unknown function (DUF397)